MSLEDNKAIIRRLYDAFNACDLTAIDKALAVNVVDLLPLKGQAPGVEGFKDRLTRLRKSFPNEMHLLSSLYLIESAAEPQLEARNHTVAAVVVAIALAIFAIRKQERRYQRLIVFL